MKPILCCTDGSVYAPSIYDHTAWAAKRADTPVTVLHMLDLRRERAELSNLSGNLGPNASEDLLAELVEFEETRNRLVREKGKALLAEAKRYLGEAGVEQVKVEQQHGELVEAVTRMEKNASLVIVGKRGESADFAKLHLGSNLERVIRSSTKPVLVAARQFRAIERFMIAYDGGPSVEKAVAFAQEQPLLKGLKCHLVRSGRIDDAAKKSLERAAEKLRAAGYEVEAECIAGNPDQVIGETVKRLEIQLLVMGAYGHSRIRQLVIGSTTTAMVRTCLIPVLMFH